jgi:hypothetical protein
MTESAAEILPLHVEYCSITGVPAEFNDLLPKYDAIDLALCVCLPPTTFMYV